MLNLSAGIGDIPAVIDAVHEIADVVGNQLASVDNEAQTLHEHVN